MVAKAKLVKVSTGYPVSNDGVTLWGVLFVKSGAKGKEKYMAEVDADTAKSLIDAGRAKKV